LRCVANKSVANKSVASKSVQKGCTSSKIYRLFGIQATLPVLGATQCNVKHDDWSTNLINTRVNMLMVIFRCSDCPRMPVASPTGTQVMSARMKEAKQQRNLVHTCDKEFALSHLTCISTTPSQGVCYHVYLSWTQRVIMLGSTLACPHCPAS